MDKTTKAFDIFATKGKILETRNNMGAVIYTRVSTKEQAENNASLDTQKKYCDQFASRRQLTVLKYFGGTYESAKSDERAEFKEMLKYVYKNPQVSYIIVYSYDRFSRTGSHVSVEVEKLKKKGVLVCSATQEVDTSTSSGTFQQDLFFLFSKFDNDMRRDKTITGSREKLRKGYITGSLPFGYTNLNPGRGKYPDLVINKEGEILKRAFMLKLQHNWSNVQISNELLKYGWKKNYKDLSVLFRNPFYCGIIVSSLIPGEVIEGKYPALISREIFLKINNILADQRNSGYQYDTHEEQLPLKQFVRAASCGTHYTGYLVKSRGRYYYKNNRIGSKENKSAEFMHKLFVDFLGQYTLADIDYIKPMKVIMLRMFTEFNKESIELTSELEGQLSKIENQLSTIERRFVLGEIDKDLYTKYKEEFDKELSRINEEISNCSFVLSNIEKAIETALEKALNLSVLWETGNIDEKKRIQKMVFPDGIVFDFQNSHYRTERVSYLFAAIPVSA